MVNPCIRGADGLRAVGVRIALSDTVGEDYSRIYSI